jgi:single-strand DNA-binding protein
MNSVNLIGRLTADPQARYTQSGKCVTRFAIAVQRRGKRDEADFPECVCWEGLAETCARHLSRGRMVAVSGEYRTQTYDGQDGKKKRSVEILCHEVRFLDFQKEGQKPDGDLPDLDADEDIPF